jgi:GAF domain-containing protein
VSSAGDADQQAATSPPPLEPGAVLDALGDAVLVAEADMRIVAANRAARHFFSDEAIVGRSIVDFIPERLRDAHVEGFRRFMESGQGHLVGGPPIRVAALVPGQGEREIELQLSAIATPDGTGWRAVGSIRDAGDRVGLEHRAATADYIRAVLEAANRLQRAPDLDTALVEVLPALCEGLDWQLAALWLLDGAGETLQCAATWQEPGRAFPELVDAWRGRSIVHGEGLVGRCWAAQQTAVAAELADEGAWPGEGPERDAGLRSAVAFPLIGRNGLLGVLTMLSAGHPPVNPEVADLLTAVGHQAGLFFDRMQDADDARRREQELRYRTALLVAQIDSAPQAVLAISEDRKVLACNRRFEELWGLASGSVKVGGQSPALQEETLSQVADPERFEQALRWGHAHPEVVQHVDVPLLDGRVIQGVSSPIVDEAGQYHGRIWFLNDDTERRRAESERSELLQRLQRSQRSQSFLLDASRVLAGAVGYAETLERLAAVAVPTLGDICLIDVVDEHGTLRRMAARHADPERQPLVDVLRRRFPPDPAGMHPSVDVTLTRRSRWSAEMTDNFLRATCRDAEHFALVKRLGFTSYMTVPLVTGDEVLGTVTLVSAGSGRRFGPEDLALAEDLADRVAQVVAKARRYDEEHRVAHTLQESLLPAAHPEVPGLRLARRYEAGPRLAEVGGDWFDVIALPDGSVRLSVGDVAGHDIAAAAAMGQLRSACRALTGHAEHPVELVEELAASWAHLGVERIATLVVAQVDPVTGRVEVASAGHPPPLAVTEDRSWFLPVDPGPPLGAPAVRAAAWHGTLDPDSALLLYTDGLVEERGEELGLGLARLAELAVGITDPDELCDHVLAHAPRTRDDDIALLALRLAPR